MEAQKPCINTVLFAFYDMTFFIYVLYSQSINRFYVGHSEDPFRRLTEHNFGKHFKSTTHGRPWILKAVFEVKGERGDALKIEKFIKKQKSRALIEKLIDSNFTPQDFLAQLVRVPHVRD
ncbi:Predicted endonuclease, GIY-YIG superfamily [Algoriphagus faecimaris]|uniref:Predicted endonuclease, GIY-YIG superfamily n=2 Tax=Algoriphagus faecimaris TaxID=686796 RepID=A0A1G6R969_9BACT|nr:Predicted endonuclease, GIY-YIG superfamily [Algoriphagus faecimaris]